MNKTDKKIWRQQRQEAGLCRECNYTVAATSKIFCEQHLARNREYQAKSNQLLDKSTCKFRSLRSNAGARDIPFNISYDEFVKWFESQPSNCHYCKVPESSLASQTDKKKRKLTVDRMDNSRGYEPGNMCLACYRCNNLKSDFFKYEEWCRIAEQCITPRLDEYHNITGRKYPTPSDA
jgi:hypothetical protein